MCAAECKKRKKMYYAGAEKKKKYLKELCPGMKGVIVTCNGIEKSCVIEAYKLFSEYADILYGPEVQDGASGTDVDFDDAVTQELKELKEKSAHRRFQSVESGAKNVVFIQCEAPVCPEDLVHYMLTSIKASRKPCAKHCLRVLPITHICRAFQNDIKKCANEMLAPHFHIPDSTKQFAVVYKARNNSEIIRDNVILWIAEAVNKGDIYKHKVDLSNPDLVILVEIMKSLCCMCVVKDFHKLRKYNIQELMVTESEEDRVPLAQNTNKEPSDTSSCPKD